VVSGPSYWWALQSVPRLGILSVEMKPEHWFMLCNLLLTAVGLYVGPKIAVRRAVEQFRSQKWWERKATAYDDVIRAASRVRWYYSKWFEIETKGWQMAEEWKKDADEKRKEAMAVLDSYTDWAGFVISEEAGSAIERIIQSLEHSDRNEAPFEYHERVVAVAMKEMAALKQCAVLDLS
jgi:hypothetical protein